MKTQAVAIVSHNGRSWPINAPETLQEAREIVISAKCRYDNRPDRFARPMCIVRLKALKP